MIGENQRLRELFLIHPSPRILCMPKISQFFGIVIYMYFRDHAPPHFHAQYGEFEGLIGIDSRTLIQGNLPPRVLGLVMEWASLYSKELSKSWEAASKGSPPHKIPPLK